MTGAGDPDMRYRFDIVGRSVVDVVMAAGGWLYDRATAGWDVTVLIDDAEDTRPLQILGAKVLDLASVLTQWEHWPHPQTIAVCAEMFDGHARVRQGVIDALEHSSTEVTLWGDVLSRVGQRRRRPPAPAQRGGSRLQGAGAARGRDRPGGFGGLGRPHRDVPLRAGSVYVGRGGPEPSQLRARAARDRHDA